MAKKQLPDIAAMGARTEGEQREVIEDALRKYGVQALAVVVLLIGGIAGNNYWQTSQADTRQQQTAVLRDFLDARAGDAGEHIGKLEEEYRAAIEQIEDRRMHTLINLVHAVRVLDEQDNNRTLELLEEARAQASGFGGDAVLDEITLLYVAQFMVGTGKPQEALRLVDGVKPLYVPQLMEEVRGDIHAALEQWEEAADAYERARAYTFDEGTYQAVLRLKHLDAQEQANGVEIENPEAATEASETEVSSDG